MREAPDCPNGGWAQALQQASAGSQQSGQPGQVVGKERRCLCMCSPVGVTCGPPADALSACRAGRGARDDAGAAAGRPGRGDGGQAGAAAAQGGAGRPGALNGRAPAAGPAQGHPGHWGGQRDAAAARAAEPDRQGRARWQGARSCWSPPSQSEQQLRSKTRPSLLLPTGRTALESRLVAAKCIGQATCMPAPRVPAKTCAEGHRYCRCCSSGQHSAIACSGPTAHDMPCIGAGAVGGGGGQHGWRCRALWRGRRAQGAGAGHVQAGQGLLPGWALPCTPAWQWRGAR